MGTIFGVFLPNDYQIIFTKLINELHAPMTPTEDYMEKWLQRYTRFESILAYLNDGNAQIKIKDELQEEMKKLSIPVHAIFGAKDGLYDLKRQQDAVALIPNAKSEMAEEAGHYMPYNNPELCVDFIKKVI